jgi:hypothetical protein
MALVKAVREHFNMYGDKPKKADGDTYELAENMVPTLVSAGLVVKMTKEEAAEVEPQPAGRGAKSKH